MADCADPVEVKEEPVAEEGEPDLTPGTLEKTLDPVRMYLRDMGTFPLLTREGEVAIAKRIEHGELLVLKTISRAPLILKELLQVGEDLRNGSRSIEEIVQFDDEELTEEKIANKTKEVLKIIDRIEKRYEVALRQTAKLRNTRKSKKYNLPRPVRARADPRRMSQLVRSIQFNPMEKKRLVDKIRHTFERFHSLEREVGRLERRAHAARGRLPVKRARNCARAARN